MSVGSGIAVNTNLSENNNIVCFIVNDVAHFSGYIVPKTAGTGMIAMSLPGYSFRTYLTFPLAGYFGGAAEGEALSGTQEIIVSINNAAIGNVLR